MTLNGRDFAIAVFAAILVNVLAALRTRAWNWGYLGWGVIVCSSVYILLGHGTRWEFGPRYGMPKALVAPDGIHHLDGSEINLFTLATIRAGNEEEILLAGFVFLGLLLAVHFGRVWRTYRRELRRAKFQILEDLWREALARGDRQEADYIGDRYAELAATGRVTWPKQARRPDSGADPSDPRGSGAGTA